MGAVRRGHLDMQCQVAVGVGGGGLPPGGYAPQFF